MVATPGSISKVNLEQHTITYDEEAYTCDAGDSDASSSLRSSLPDNVDALREALVTFSRIIPDGSIAVFDEEFAEYGSEISEESCLRPPPEAEEDRKIKTRSQQPTLVDDNWDACKSIAQKARDRTKKRQTEANWTNFLRQNIFTNFDDLVPGDSRTETELLFDQWSLQENFQWNDFRNWPESNSGKTRRTDPKPNLTYGFPIISSAEGQPTGFSRDEYVQSFSLDVLEELCLQGVRSAVTTGLRRRTEAKNGVELKDPDSLCYPWAIVEVTRSQVKKAEVTKCYCQAANASAAALSLQQQLLDMAFGTVRRMSSPIIAFTCVGPQVKVWLTYCLKESNRQSIKMSCIWSTSLELTWGVVVLRYIVQKMHIWSSRILKPKIVAAICQIREKLSHAVSLPTRTIQDHKSRFRSTPPATPSPRKPRRSRHRSPSVQSRQSDESNTDYNTASADSNAVTSNDQIFSLDDESRHTASRRSGMESDDGNHSDPGDDSRK